MSKAALNPPDGAAGSVLRRVRVNAIAPGLGDTPWTEDWDALPAAVAAQAPVPRSATPDDCAEAVLGLLRTRYATGEVFVVDGGLTQSM
jgi:ketoreductase RED2